MAPNVSYVKTKLSYPIYAADFDPYSRGYLATAGGGGESKSGIGNKITLLDVRDPRQIIEAAEIELPKSEDNPTCVANLATQDGLITFAGVNSGSESIKKGTNQHFRSFSVQYPAKASNAGSHLPKTAALTQQEIDHQQKQIHKGALSLDQEKEALGLVSQLTEHKKCLVEQERTGQLQGSSGIVPIGKTQLFTQEKQVEKQDSYQRVIRLSPARRRGERQTPNKRLGAIATGSAQKSEIIVFDATTSTPGERDIINRIWPPNNDEAKDLDWEEEDEAKFKLGYCTDSAVYVRRLGFDFASRSLASTVGDPPEKVWSISGPQPGEGPGRRKIRALRFLTPNHLLLLVNLPSFKGAEMLILRLYNDGPGEAVLRKRLASHVKAATGLDVCALDADPQTGARQIIVAVAGQDQSVSVFTLDYEGTKSDAVSKFRSFNVTRDVHDVGITAIRLSPFQSPSSLPPNANGTVSQNEAAAANKKSIPPQRVHLATVSMGNTVVVDTIPLQSFSGRYILTSARAEQIQNTASLTAFALIALIAAFLLQSFIAASYPDSAIAGINLQQYVPPQIQEVLGRLAPPGSHRRAIVEEVEQVFQAVEGVITHPFDGETKLTDLIAHLREGGHLHHSDIEHPEHGAIIIRSSDAEPDSGNPDTVALSTDLHPEGAKSVLLADKNAKTWDELDEKSKAIWRKKLGDAGAWLESEGETVLKGIFFSSYAGVIGDIAAQALR